MAREIGEPFLLFFDQKFRIADNVDEQHMPDLELRIGG